MNRVAIKNGKIITPNGIRKGVLTLEDGKIKSLGRTVPAGSEVIDAEGNYVSPGFIDIHTHGAGGADYMDGTVEAYCTAARMTAAHGATLVYPTTLTSTNEALFESFETFRKAVKANKEGSTFGGMHLEGPYFNPAQAGAQDPRYLRCPSPEDYNLIMEKGRGLLKRWSFAPELDGAPEFAAAIRKHGILASIGHTAASFEECDASFKSGATHMTHFYSCMSTITRKQGFRIAGVLEYGYFQDGMSIELIADGIHVPSSLLHLIIKLKGVERIALVSDSMRAAGMPEGPSILGGLNGGQEVIVEDGVAKMPDRSCFAGSVATADRLVRTIIKEGGVSLEDAVRMMTLNPAHFMRIERRKGSIEVGKDADIVIFDNNIEIKRTIINGKTIYLC